jgi:penicillin-binding protein 2
MADQGAPGSGNPRVMLIGVLVASLLVTLTGRLYFVQILDRNKPVQTAGGRHEGQIIVPAARGDIVDDRGRPLVGNTATHVVTVSWETLQNQPDRGQAVLTRLAALTGTSEQDLAQETTPCGVEVPSPCWTGEPYQPVPVVTDAATQVVLAISEHREDFPGVAVQTQVVRNYPGGSLAAHVLGYAGAVSADDEKVDSRLHDADTIGRTGLEAQYDSALRGVDGAQVVELDALGQVVGNGPTAPPQQGDTLVTSIDSGVQALAEKALATQIAASRAKGKPATGGAAVVMDPRTGRIIAAASYPTYDPQVFVGGISVADYAKLTAPAANDPLVGRAIAGAYAPGSTFKLITSSADVTDGDISTEKKYPCPGSLTIDGRVKTNYESESFAYPLTLEQALDVSCDTFFYAPAARDFYLDQARVATGGKAREALQKMAAAYGIGTPPGVDLPDSEQASGSYADRETRLARWNANKQQYCADAKSGFPQQADPAQRAYLVELARENCTDGWRYRAGDNADMAIGQGETTVSPLQLAVAYSAMLNGGTVWKPTIGWAVVDASGKVVATIQPTPRTKVPVARSTLSYIANALHFTSDHTVSGALAFDGSPYKTQLGAKTGTAEVFGRQDTSWLASWGPVGTDAAHNPTATFVVVGMIEQAGTGATAAAPMVRQIYNGLLGVGQPPLLPASRPIATLPQIVPAALAPTPVPAPPSAPAAPSAPAPSSGPSSPGPGALPTSLPDTVPAPGQTRGAPTRPRTGASTGASTGPTR